MVIFRFQYYLLLFIFKFDLGRKPKHVLIHFLSIQRKTEFTAGLGSREWDALLTSIFKIYNSLRVCEKLSRQGAFVYHPGHQLRKGDLEGSWGEAILKITLSPGTECRNLNDICHNVFCMSCRNVCAAASHVLRYPTLRHGRYKKCMSIDIVLVSLSYSNSIKYLFYCVLYFIYTK